MSFGNRKVQQIGARARNAGRAQGTQVRQQTQNESDVGSTVLLSVSAFAVVCMILATAQFAFPVTYSSNSVYYSNMDLAQSAMARGMIKKYREKAEKRYGVDFSRVLTPADQEVSKDMKYVAQACLPSGGKKNVAMPSKVHEVYFRATNYLICAMATQTQRFCQPSERQRLVEQLMQYKDRRQNALAVERVRDAILKTAGAQHQIRMMRMVKGGTPRNINPKIGNELDQRIGVALAKLHTNGFISPSDFSWMGLVLPAEYAPFLTGEVTNASCA